LIPIPEVVGYPLEEAKVRLEGAGYRVVILETLDKKTAVTDHIRVLRQQRLNEKEIQLIISYF